MAQTKSLLPGIGIRQLVMLLAALVLSVTSGIASVAPQSAISTPVLFSFDDNSQSWEASGPAFRARIRPTSIEAGDGQSRLRSHYINANSDARMSGEGAPSAVVNRLIGNEPSRWRTGLEAFQAIRVAGLYAGIDLRVSSQAGRLKSEYHVAPGADPQWIRIRHEGTARCVIENSGQLRIETPQGDWTEAAPVAWQHGGSGGVIAVEASWRIFDDHSVGFDLGPYNPALPLVIDPVLSFSSTFGSFGSTVPTGVVTDASGYIYVSGYTDGDGFGGVSPAGARGGGVDAFVMKLAPGGTSIVYATYIGGSGDDRAFALSVDPAGSAYVVGWTTSANFPVANAARPALSGGRDAYLLKLSGAGSAIAFSTFFGGSGVEAAYAVRADSAGAWIAGDTDSSNLPLSGAWQSSRRGGSDAFLARFGAGGALVSSTYAGGNGTETIRTLATDSGGNVYAAGASDSTDLGLPSNSFQRVPRGGQDALVLKFNSSASQLLAGMFVGGTLGSGYSGAEIAQALAVGSTNGVVIGGLTPSSDFPLKNALSGVFAGGLKGFIAKLNADFTALSWSTYVGGTGRDSVEALALDAAERVYAGGRTTSLDLAQIGPIQTGYHGAGDAFVQALSADGSRIEFSSYLGGSGADALTGLAIGPSGSILVSGSTASLDFPQLGSFTPATGSRTHMFVSEIRTVNSPPQLISVTPSSGNGDSQVLEFLVRDPDGAGDLRSLAVLINDSLVGYYGCYISVHLQLHKMHLSDDLALNWPFDYPGSSTVFSNSQCELRLAGSSVVAAGNEIRVRLDIGFRAGSNGRTQVYALLADFAGNGAGWSQLGTWDYTATPNQPPTAVSLSPTAATGTRAVFSVTASDPDGSSDIRAAVILVGSSMSGTNSCYIAFHNESGNIHLADDPAIQWPFVTIGSTATLSNSQCTVRALTSSRTTTANTVTFNVDLEFNPSWTGTKNVYARFTDWSGGGSPWSQMGAYTVGASSPTAQPPQVTSVAPNSGAGSGAVFTWTYSDANGATDINNTVILINGAYSSVSGCFIVFERATQRVHLASNSGTSWTSAVVGQTVTLQNTQCLIRMATSSVTASGTTLQLRLDIGFRAGFLGAKSLWTHAIDNGGLIGAPYQLMGTYTVTSAQAGLLGTGSGSSVRFRRGPDRPRRPDRPGPNPETEQM